MTPLPTPPSTSDPTNFDARADAFLAALLVFQTEVNALGTPGLGGGDMLADLGIAAEVSVASATTCNIGAAASNKVAITGTTPITSFGTTANRLKFIRFGGALTLTHNATSLILPGGANITTAAGDTCVAMSDASGNWRVYSYQAARFAPPEAGLWTPTLLFATPGTSSFSYATQTGRYTRFVDRVTVEVTLVFTPTIGTGSGELQVSAPVAPATTAGASGAITNISGGFSWSANAVLGVGVGSSRFRVLSSAAGANAALAASNMTTGVAHTLVFSLTYRV